MQPRPIRKSSLALLGAVAAAVIFTLPAAAAGPKITAKAPGRSPIHVIQDDQLTVVANPAQRIQALAAAGAAVIRVDLVWDAVAPTRPANAANPGDPAYAWGRYDAIVAAANANHLEVLFTVYGTPSWARDATVVPETDMPLSAIRPADAADYGRFARAAATRYAPLGVHKWEAWNEPNIKLFLWPQYEAVGGVWRPASPATYAALAKAFYAAVKAVDPAATIAGGVTAPVGDDATCTVALCKNDQPNRVQADVFFTALNAPALRPPMDVVSHHPYPITAPRATSRPNLKYIDLYNLSRLTTAIDRTYLKGKGLWLTEYGFATDPVVNYATYFSRAKQAAYIVDAFRRLRANSRVKLAGYYNFQDHPEWRSGVLDQAGRRKLGYAALALPLSQVTPGAVRSGVTTDVVGQVRIAAAAVNVAIERKAGGKWVKAKVVRTARDGSFRVGVKVTARVTLRARWSGVARSGATVSAISPPVTIAIR